MARRLQPDIDDTPGRPLGTRIFAALIMIVAVGVFGLVVWRAATTDEPAQNIAEVPLIAADDGPVRVRPSDPGGMPIPHQDKLIYRTLEGGDGEPAVERLLPPPEEPVDRTPPRMEAPTSPTSPAPAAGDLPTESDVTARPVEIEPEVPAPAAPEPAPEVAAAEPPPSAVDDPSDNQAVAPDPAPVSPDADDPPQSFVTIARPPEPESPPPTLEVAEPRPVPTVASATMPAAAFRVQLAAFRGRADAEQAWREIRAGAPGLLAGLRSEVVRADLGAEKGVFYRLRAGPIADREAAKALCASLQARNQDCLVVAP